MSIGAITSATSSAFSFLSGRTTGAKVLAGGSLVAAGSTMFLGGHNQPTGFWGGLLKITDNVMSVLGVASIFCAPLTLPVAIYFGVRGVTELASGNYLNGGLQLLGALPIFGVLKSKNLLGFKSMVKSPVDEAVAKLLKVDNLKDPAKALKAMGENVGRLESEVNAAGKVFTGAAEKAQKAGQQVTQTIEELTKKGIVKSEELAGKSLTKQSRTVSRNLRAKIAESTGEVNKLQKVVDDASAASKKAKETLDEALKAATSEADKKLLQEGHKIAEEARKKALNLDQIQKDLLEAKNKLKEFTQFQKSFNGKLRTWGQAQLEVGFAGKELEAHTKILNDAKHISTRTEELTRGDLISGFDSEAQILDDYRKIALQTIKTDYGKFTKTAIGRSYGPVSESQFEGILKFVQDTRDKGSRVAARNAVKSVRTWWRDVLHGTAPDPLPQELARAA